MLRSVKTGKMNKRSYVMIIVKEIKTIYDDVVIYQHQHRFKTDVSQVLETAEAVGWITL